MLRNLGNNELPLGYKLDENKNLLVPYYVSNDSEFRIAQIRNSGFTIPFAAAGFLIGGPVGLVAGSILGSLLGYARGQAIRGSV